MNPSKEFLLRQNGNNKRQTAYKLGQIIYPCVICSNLHFVQLLNRVI